MVPRKSGSPTVSRRLFRVATPAPKNTPAIPSHGLVTNLDLPAGACGAGAELTAALIASLPSLLAVSGPDSRDNGHAGAQAVRSCLALFKHDLHGDALDDLGEIACGIVRGKQCELRSASGRQLIDPP